MMELDPIYVDVIVRRFEEFTGIKAVHLESGLTFDGTAHNRQADCESQGVAEAPTAVRERSADPIDERLAASAETPATDATIIKGSTSGAAITLTDATHGGFVESGGDAGITATVEKVDGSQK
jgi:hypothetical protein